MNKVNLKRIKKENYALMLILALSGVLNIANLSLQGYGNAYYAAGVKSMTMSWSNFFFVSFDPSGFVSIDKPPLGFWIQALSAKIFGYSSWSLLLPQAIAGVISVGIIYIIVRKSIGTAAGLISALVLATTPVFVAVSRNNTVDNLLVLVLLLACWALSAAAEKGRFRWLALSLVLVGIGFNIKMLQAYMVIPAIYIVYLFSNAVSLKKRILHLAAGTAILLAVSLSWAVIVDMVPASSRPFVGSSTNNSVMELIVGHNGLERLGLSSSAGSGNQGIKANESFGYGGPGYGGTPPSGTGQSAYGPGSGGTPPSGGNMPSKMIGGGSGGNSTFGGSEPSSIVRLFSNNSLSDQVIWMFPLALFGLLAAALKEKVRFKVDTKEKQSLLLWGAWLVPVFAYFSFTTGLFHPYYLTMLAPPIAALSGIGMVSMWQMYKEEKGWKGWLLPAALAVTGVVQLLILSYNMNSYAFVKYIMIAVGVLCIGSSLGLSVLKAVQEETGYKLKKGLAALAMAGLLTAPLIWSGTTIFYKMSGTFPAAGLSLMSGSGMGMGSLGGIVSGDTSTTSKLVAYLKANSSTEKYLVAVPSSMSYTTDIIINYGEPVMTLGGFSGSDSILTLDEFKQLVKKGEIRYAIAGCVGGQGGNSEIMSWIQANGKAVSESEWNGSNSMAKGQSVQLYDLKGIL